MLCPRIYMTRPRPTVRVCLRVGGVPLLTVEVGMDVHSEQSAPSRVSRRLGRSPSLNRATVNRGSRLSRRAEPSVGASRSPSYQSNRKIPAKRDRCTPVSHCG